MKKIIAILLLLLVRLIAFSQEKLEIQFDSEPENLGDKVNSIYDDLSPMISPDGKTLFITRYPPGNDDKNNIWVSYLDNKGNWTKAVDIGTPLNIKGYSTSVQSFTPDGNTILLSNIYRYFDGTIQGGGCSISSRQRGGWSFPKQQNIEKFENKNDYVDYYLSNDGKIMLMAIEAKKSLGEKDIYVSFRGKEHEWSKPLNIGANVNSSGDEFGIFLASDNTTLYFASTGHGGYGNADIWMSKRLDDTWVNWSKPTNMGPKINTEGFESGFTIPASGEYAYFASEKNSMGKSDIYRIKLPTEAKPDPVVLIYGKVLDKKTGKPLKANISYELLPSGEEVGAARTSPEDGFYKITLPFNKMYGFMAESDNFYSISENLDLVGLKEYKEIEQDLYLAPIEKDIAIRINNIFFEFGKSTLKEESFPELDRLSKLLMNNESLKIEISGHTDNVGEKEDNLTLSQQRAESVVTYLKGKGVKKSNLVAQGYGEDAPVSTNETEEGRAINRRVEFKIL